MSSPPTPPPTPKRPPRRGRWASRLELGLAAFAPAFGLMALRCWEAPLLAIPYGALAVIGAVAIPAILLVVRRTNEEPFVFDEVEDAGPEVVGHVTAYVIPVVVDPTQSLTQMVIAGVAMGVIVLIHVATGRVLVSPLLYLAGRRAYAATTTDGVSYFVVARSDPADWSGPVPCRALGSAILVEADATVDRAGKGGGG